MAVRLSPADARAKQAARLKASTQEIQNQVMKVTTAPGQQAAKKADKMLQNLTASVTSGKWGRRVASVSLNDWQDAMVKKGIPRIAAGIDAAAPKVEAFYQEFFPHLEKVQSELANMPDMTLEDNIQRATHNMRRNAEFKRSR